jgi:hypothetical protein
MPKVSILNLVWLVIAVVALPFYAVVYYDYSWNNILNITCVWVWGWTARVCWVQLQHERIHRRIVREAVEEARPQPLSAINCTKETRR